jgi:hypothetical protein
MGSLAKQLGGQSQVQCFKKGGLVEKNEPKREEKREAKMSPKARAKVEKAEGHKTGGKVKGCK